MAPCSGWWAKAAALAATQAGPSVSGLNARMRTPAGSTGAGTGVPWTMRMRQSSRTGAKPKRLGQLGGALVVAVGPGAQRGQLGAFGQGGQQGAGDAVLAERRVHGQFQGSGVACRAPRRRHPPVRRES